MMRNNPMFEEGSGRDEERLERTESEVHEESVASCASEDAAFSDKKQEEKSKEVESEAEETASEKATKDRIGEESQPESSSARRIVLDGSLDLGDPSSGSNDGSSTRLKLDYLFQSADDDESGDAMTEGLNEEETTASAEESSTDLTQTGRAKVDNYGDDIDSASPVSADDFKKLTSAMLCGICDDRIVPEASLSVFAHVARVLSEKKSFVRDSLTAGIAGIRWMIDSIEIREPADGMTLDKVVFTGYGKVVDAHKVFSTAEALKNWQLINLKNVRDYDLGRLIDEAVIEVLCSAFVLTKEEEMDEIINIMEKKGNLTKIQKNDLYNFRRKKAFLSQKGMLAEDKVERIMEKISVYELVDRMILFCNNFKLKRRVADYATVTEMLASKKPINCCVFRFRTLGTTKINFKLGSVKHMRFSINDDSRSVVCHVALRCVHRVAGITRMSLEIIGETRLNQLAMVDVFSGLRRSPGKLSASLDEIMQVQDDVWMPIYSDEDLMMAMSNDEDYAVANHADLLPMMAMVGVHPRKDDNEAVAKLWSAALESIVNRLCAYGKLFASMPEERHFMMAMMHSCQMCTQIKKEEDIGTFVVNMLLWGCVDDENKYMCRASRTLFEGERKARKAVSLILGMGNQVLWSAVAVTTVDTLCKVGYRFAPIVMLWNYMAEGKLRMKLLFLGVWLGDMLNLHVNFAEEDEAMFSLADKIGIRIPHEFRRMISLRETVSAKISVLRDAMKVAVRNIDRDCKLILEDRKMATMVLTTVMAAENTSDEKSDDDDQTGSKEQPQEDALANIVAKLGNRIAEAVACGEMSADRGSCLAEQFVAMAGENDEFTAMADAQVGKMTDATEILLKAKALAKTASCLEIEKLSLTAVVEARQDFKQKTDKAMKQVKRKISDGVKRQSAIAIMMANSDSESVTVKNDLAQLAQVSTVSFRHNLVTEDGVDCSVDVRQIATDNASAVEMAAKVGNVELATLSIGEAQNFSNVSVPHRSKAAGFKLLDAFKLEVAIGASFDAGKFNDNLIKLLNSKKYAESEPDSMIERKARLSENKQKAAGKKAEIEIISESPSGDVSSSADESDEYSLWDELKLCFDTEYMIKESWEANKHEWCIKMGRVVCAGNCCVEALCCVAGAATDWVWDTFTKAVNAGFKLSGTESAAEKYAKRKWVIECAKIGVANTRIAILSSAFTVKIGAVSAIQTVRSLNEVVKQEAMASPTKIRMAVAAARKRAAGYAWKLKQKVEEKMANAIKKTEDGQRAKDDSDMQLGDEACSFIRRFVRQGWMWTKRRLSVMKVWGLKQILEAMRKRNDGSNDDDQEDGKSDGDEKNGRTKLAVEKTGIERWAEGAKNVVIVMVEALWKNIASKGIIAKMIIRSIKSGRNLVKIAKKCGVAIWLIRTTAQSVYRRLMSIEMTDASENEGGSSKTERNDKHLPPSQRKTNVSAERTGFINSFINRAVSGGAKYLIMNAAEKQKEKDELGVKIKKTLNDVHRNVRHICYEQEGDEVMGAIRIIELGDVFRHVKAKRVLDHDRGNCDGNKLEMISYSQYLEHENGRDCEAGQTCAIDTVRVRKLKNVEVLMLGEINDEEELGIKNKEHLQISFDKDWLHAPEARIKVSAMVDGKKCCAGYASVIRKNSTSEEAMMTCSHLINCGKRLHNDSTYEELVCLAVCASESSMCGELETNELDETSVRSNTNGHERKPSVVIADAELGTQKNGHAVVSTAKRDWKGMSGSCVVTAKGNLVGILIMQIRIKIEGLEDCNTSLIVASRELDEQGGIFVVEGCQPEACRKCVKPKEDSCSEEDFYDSKTRLTRSSSEKSCGSGDWDRKRNQNELLGPDMKAVERRSDEKRVIEREKEKKKDQEQEKGNGLRLSLTSRMKKWLIGLETEAEEDGCYDGADERREATNRNCEKTGALQEVCKGFNEIRRESCEVGLDAVNDAEVAAILHAVVRVGRSSEMTEDLSRGICEIAHDAIVSKRPVLLICMDNAVALATACLLSACKTRFERLRSLNEIISLSCASNMEKRARVFLCWGEDLLKSFVLSDVQLVSTKQNELKIALVTPDLKEIKSLAIVVLRHLSSVSEKAAVLITNNRKHDAASCSSSNKGRMENVVSKKTARMQNAGNLVRMDVSNNIVAMHNLNKKGRADRELGVSVVVFTACHSYVVMSAIKRRVATILEVHENVISVMNYNALGMAAMWQLIRIADTVVFHDGIQAEFKANASFTTCQKLELSDTAANLMKDAMRAALIVNEERLDDVKAALSISEMVEGSNDKIGTKSNLFVIENKNGGQTLSMTIKNVLERESRTVVAGVLLKPANDFVEHKVMEVACDDGDKELEVSLFDLISEQVKEVVDAQGTVWSAVRNWMRRVTGKVRLKANKAKECVNDICFSLVEWIKKTVRRQVVRTKKIKTSVTKRLKTMFGGKPGFAKTFAEAGCDDEAKEELTATSVAARAIEILLISIAAANSEIKGQAIGSELSQADRSMLLGASWTAIRCITDSCGGKAKKTIDAVAKTISRVAAFGEVAAAVMEWDKTVEIGPFCYSPGACRPSYVKIAMITAGWLKRAAGGRGSMKCKRNSKAEKTGEIILAGFAQDKGAVLAKIIDLTGNVFRAISRGMLKFKMGVMLREMWASMKTRGDTYKAATGKLAARPCYELKTAAAGIIIVGCAVAAGISLAKRDAEIATATIGVISERKHTADAINIYLKDRSTYSYVMRLSAICYAIAACCMKGIVFKVTGVIAATSWAVDVFICDADEFGYGYRMSHGIGRAVNSKSKISALILAITAARSKDSISECLMNCVVLTGNDGTTREFGEVTVWNESKMAKVLKMIAEEQNKEGKANEALMDKSVAAAEAYRKAVTIMRNGNHFADDVCSSELWDINDQEQFEEIDVLEAATGEVSMLGSERKVVQLGDMMVNQCRYLGRTRKMMMGSKDEGMAYESKGKGVKALDDKLWEGILKEDDFKDFDPARDSRAAVLLAIAERNDMPINVSVTEEVLAAATRAANELVGNITKWGMKAIVNAGKLEWHAVLCNTNEKATAGIITRRRQKSAVTAGYVPDFKDNVSAAKELLVNGDLKDSCSITNVFAKRRIEKKKQSRLAGVECVITRTIQASEADVKLATIECFLSLDKIMKMTRNENLMSVGINFFIEYCKDDAMASFDCNDYLSNYRQVRVSLDHSSYDASQRCWAIMLCKLMRKELIETANEDDSKRVNAYLNSCYEMLRIKLMMSNHGDLFALTGQQMTGHATTSSDNSFKAALYALAAADLIQQDDERCEIIKRTIRVQGDDTKFMMRVRNDVSDEQAQQIVSREMERLGQVVKAEKMEITDGMGSAAFLSHKRVETVFKMKQGGRIWFEIKELPYRKRRDNVSILGRVLKQVEAKKTKKDISLLAAKAMSFLIMYISDYVIVSLAVVVIWTCFSLLTGAGKISNKVDIKKQKLPWLLAQSEIMGEFEVDIRSILKMHGVGNADGDVSVEGWVMEMTADDVESLKNARKFVNNAERVFKSHKLLVNENVSRYLSSLDKARVGRKHCFKVGDVEDLLMSMSKVKPVADINEGEVTYAPYVRMKMKTKDKVKDEISAKVDYVVVCKQRNEISTLDLISVIEALTKSKIYGLSKIGKIVTDDGLKIVGLSAEIVFSERMKTAVVTNDVEARAFKCKIWNVFNVVWENEEQLGWGEWMTSMKTQMVTPKLRMTSLDRSLQMSQDELEKINWQNLASEKRKKLNGLPEKVKKLISKSFIDVLVIEMKLWGRKKT